MMEVVLIVAVAENGVIGAGGAIPWRLKSDQQRLKMMTMGKGMLNPLTGKPDAMGMLSDQQIADIVAYLQALK